MDENFVKTIFMARLGFKAHAVPVTHLELPRLIQLVNGITEGKNSLPVFFEGRKCFPYKTDVVRHHRSLWSIVRSSALVQSSSIDVNINHLRIPPEGTYPVIVFENPGVF